MYNIQHKRRFVKDYFIFFYLSLAPVGMAFGRFFSSFLAIAKALAWVFALSTSSPLSITLNHSWKFAFFIILIIQTI